MTMRPMNNSEADVDMRDVEMRDVDMRDVDMRDDERDDEPLLLPAPKIFLSYSGVQISFVEQLSLDLKNRGHTPFFDRSSESLPMGMEFPKRILQAAKQCVVGVVVLSNDYLISKWPMLELLAFVDAQKTCNPELRILPLFYNLGVSGLKDKASIQKWKAKWQDLAAMDDRFRPSECEDALGVLIRTKGKNFSEFGGSEVSYREAIVADLDHLSRHHLKYDTPPMMVGRTRLCQIVRGELERQSQVNGGRPAVLGLFGRGGMGKTLLCKALCNHFREEYAGRVCHVECSKSSGSLELQKLILEELTDANKSFLPNIRNSAEALTLISVLLPREAVFLAVDNVKDGDLEWLQFLFDRKHNPKSKFVVTSRCPSNVQMIVGDRCFCRATPSLTEEEAWELFLQSAVPTRLQFLLSFFADQQNLKILEDCIKQCFYSRDSRGSSSQHPVGLYNPRQLQALGSSIKEDDPSTPHLFIQMCRMSGKQQHFYKHRYFETLRTEYDELYPPLCKLLFLDVALFAPREKLRKLDDLCTWLEGMYDYNQGDILFMLRSLRRSSLIEDWGMHTKSQITLDDSLKDFAAYELRVVEAENRWAVYHDGDLSDLPHNLESSPPGRNWPNLVRVYLRIKNQLPGAGCPQLDVLKSIVLASPRVMFPEQRKIQEWENLQFLCLEGFESEQLDVAPLKCLRNLKLVSFELRILRGCNQLKQLRFVELDCSGLHEGLDFSRCSKLQELVTGEIYSLQKISLPQSPSDLKIFKLHGWNKFLPVHLDLRQHRHLREVAIAHTIWDTGRASLWGNWSLALMGLQFLTGLVGLTLIKLPISSLPGLENLVGLEFLNLRGCAKLEALPDLRSFLRLKWVNREGCERLPPDQPLVSRKCKIKTRL